MLSIKSSVLVLLAVVGHVLTQSPPGDIVGKMVVGYQGWFAVQGDGSPRNLWVHWAQNIAPRPGRPPNITFELYPDVREYQRLYETELGDLGNGEPARLFSSWDDSTVDLHFRWMVQYNYEVVALQRFGAAVRGNTLFANQVNGIAAKVQACSERYNRKFFITWDVSDWPNFPTELIEDINSVRARGVFNSAAYARQNGKIVIGVWGFGFINRPSNPAAALNVVRQLKAAGYYVMGGVPANWRTGDSDSLPGHIDVYTNFSMIQPWAVGRFSGVDGAQSYEAQERADLQYCTERNIDYQPVLYPGFAWSNWKNGPRNVIPRLHGDFIWRQFVNIRELGIQNAYIAMFDEYDEGTAIAKAAEDLSMIPNNQYFLTLDADGVHVSSDFYLRVVSEGNRMMKGQVALRFAHNVPFVIGPTNSNGNVPIDTFEGPADGIDNESENGPDDGSENGPDDGSENGPDNGSENGSEDGPLSGRQVLRIISSFIQSLQSLFQ